MINFIRKIWNKIFGKTSFGWYYDNKKLKGKTKNKRKNTKQNNVTTSTYNRNRHDDYGFSFINLDNRDEDRFIDFNLIDKDASEKDKKEVKTFTKKWVDIILTVSLVDVQLVFALAFMGKTQIAESLGIAIATEIIGVFGGYMIRGWMDSHSKAKDDMELEKMRRSYQDYSVKNDPIVNIDDTEAVG